MNANVALVTKTFTDEAGNSVEYQRLVIELIDYQITVEAKLDSKYKALLEYFMKGGK